MEHRILPKIHAEICMVNIYCRHQCLTKVISCLSSEYSYNKQNWILKH